MSTPQHPCADPTRYRDDLYWIYNALLSRYGPQHWWPADTPFEVMVGAVLTQNTSWINVERSIQALRDADHLHPTAIATADHVALAAWLRPVGYFNVKARRLQDFCRWYLTQGEESRLAALPTASLRAALLSVKGVGPETADDMLLYAFGRPVFVIDAYTRRLLVRFGMAQGDEPYEVLRTFFEEALDADATIYNEYHALIVQHAKDTCRKRQARCSICPVSLRCPLSMGA